jgi:hypothetical protein
MERAGFDEFVTLECRKTDRVAVRERTKRAIAMRWDARRVSPGKCLSFSERDVDQACSA